MRRWKSPVLFFACCSLACVVFAAGADTILKYGDGEPDGKRSISGSGEIIGFKLPADKEVVKGIRIHGSRYGTPEAPDESFLIYFLSEDMSEIVHTEMAPYSLFERGPEKWVDIAFKTPVKVPKVFWVALDFRALRTKGIYVSFDTSTGGQYSRVGLPGIKANTVDFAGDWMVQAVLSKP
jgi:RNA polymerase sigma-70 factor (ECF subfamily)